MSDMFDHALDAFESYDRSFDEGDGYYSPRDPLYNHTKVEFNSIVRETEKAIQLSVSPFREKEITLNIWLPKSWLRKQKDGSCYVWSEGWWKNFKKETMKLREAMDNG